MTKEELIRELAETRQRLAVLEKAAASRGRAGAAASELASFPELNPDPIAEVDLSGRVHYCNPAARQLFPDLEEQGFGHPWLAGLEASGRKLREGGAKSATREIAIGEHYYHQALHYVEEQQRLRIQGLDITKRKVAEEALRQSEERYRLALRATNDALWDMNLATGKVQWNEAYAKAFGRAPQTADSWQWWIDHIHADDRERTVQCFRKAIDGQADNWVCEYRFLRADGTWADIYERAYIARDRFGNAWRVVGSMLDLTERKRAEGERAAAEASLRKGEERLRLALEAAHMATWDWDVPSGNVVWNDESFRMLGYEPGQFQPTYQHWADRVHPDDLPAAEAHIRLAMEQGTDLRSEFRARWPDGTMRFLEVLGRFERDAAGRTVRCYGTMLDITERKQAEEALERRVAERTAELAQANDALRRAAEHTRRISEAIADPLLLIDPDGKITDVNRATEEITGRSREELVATDFSEYFADPTAARAGYREVFDKGHVRDYPLEVRHRDGHLTPLLCNATVYRDENGQIGGVFAAARDITERRRAEEALRRSEERYRSLAETARDMIFIIGRDDRVEYVNGFGAASLGRPAEEVVGQPRTVLFPPSVAARQHKALRRVFATGEPRHIEGVSRFPGGDIWLDTCLTPLRNEAGEVVSVLGISRDITERKRMEETLRESERKYRDLIETTDTGFVIIDGEGRVLDANAKYVSLTGHERLEEILGRCVTEWTAPDEVQMNRAAVRQCYEEGSIRGLVVHYVDRAGRRTPLEINATVVQGPAGHQIMSICRDITDRKRAEEALRRSEERYRSLAEAARDMIFIIGRDDRVEYVNSFGAASLGRPAEEVVGQPRTTLFPPALASRQQQSLQRVFATGEPIHIEGVSRFPGGDIWLDTSLTPLRNEAGEVVSVLGISRDVTDRKRMEETLRESERKYRDLIETTDTGFVIIDGEGRVLDANAKYVSLTGHERLEEILGRCVTEWTAPDEVQMNRAAVRQCYEEGSIRGLVVHYVDRAGRRTPLEINATVVQGPAGHQIMSICRDITDRKRAEEALRRSEERYRSLAETARDMIYIVGGDDRVEYVNSFAAASLRRPVKEIVGLSRAELFPPPVASIQYKWLQQVLKTGEPIEAEDLIPFPGHSIWLSTRLTPLRNGAGEVVSVLGISRDITDRKRMEEALRESEERYRAIFEQVADSVLLFDAATAAVVEFNDRAHQSLGYTREEFARLSIADIAAATTPAEILENRDLVVSQGAHTFETRHRTKTGEIRDMEVRARCLSLHGREYILSTCRDVTDERRAAAALAASEQKFRDLAEGMPDGASLVVDGKFAWVNAAYCQMFGYREEELVGQGVERTIAPELRQAIMQRMAARLAGKSLPTRYEAVGLRKDGTRFDVENSVRVVNVAGRPGVQSVIRDITERKRAEEALRASEERYRAITENAIDCVFCKDTDRRYTFCNQATQRLAGLPAEALLGKRAEDLVEPGSAELMRKADEDTLTGRVINRVGTLQVGDRPVTFHVVQVPLHNERGEVVGLTGIARDVTEQQRLADALRASEERYRAITENAQDAIFCKDAERRYTFANPATLSFLGLSAEQFVGKTPEEVFGAENAATIREVDEANLRGEVVNAARALRLGGRDVVLHTVQVPLRDGAGKVVGITGIVRDVTDQHRLEEALRASEATYHTIFDATADGLFVQDCDTGAILEMNAAARQMMQRLGRSPGASDIGDIVSSEAPFTREEALRRIRAAAQGQPQRFEWKLNDPQGRPAWFLVDVSCAEIQGRKRLLAVTRDITELRRAQEERLRIQKLESLGLLAGGIAHDFNNMLTCVRAAITLAKLDETVSPDVTGLLRDAEEAVGRAAGLTHQLMTFSRGGAPVRQSASIVQLLRETTGFALTGSNVRPHFDIPDDLWAADVDTAQISQVMQNLVLNAKEAMPDGGVVEVAASNFTHTASDSLTLSPGRYIRLIVRDHGVGIPPEQLPRIFDPYFTTKGARRGLGLAVAHSVVRRHGGHILVRSDPGAGSTFEVYLPAAGALAPTNGGTVEHLRRQGRVLVMDDNPDIRRLSGRMLGKVGFTVAGAGDGAEAITLYSQARDRGEPFDVVILDLTVATGMGGEACLQELRALDPDVRAIVVSGFAEDPVMAEFRQRGFRAVLRKPYSLGELARAIDEARA